MIVVVASVVWTRFTFKDLKHSALYANSSEQVTADSSESENRGAAEFDFSEIKNKETLFERRLALFTLIDEAEEKTLGELFDQSMLMASSSFQRELSSTIVRKWASVSPQAILTHMEGITLLRYRDLLPLVFEEWARSDLDEAVSYAKKFGPDTRKIVFNCIREFLEGAEVNEVMEIAQKLNIEYYATHQMFRELARSEIDDPVAALAQFLDENRNRFRVLRDHKSNYLRAIADAIGALGADALYEASAMLTNANDRVSVIPRIVHRVAQHDPQGALEFVLADTQTITDMAWGVVLTWAKSDPSAALAAVSDIKNHTRRAYLVGTVLDQWSKDDPFSLLQELHDFPENTRQLAEEKARVAVAEHSPQEATEWLLEIEDLNKRASVASQMVKSWAKSDATAVLEWIQSDGDLASMRDRLVRDVVREVTMIDPQWAIDTALEYSVPDDAIGPEADFISVIAQYDPDTALKILPVARNETTKLAGLMSIGTHLTRRTGDSYERAIELADQLSSEEDRHRYLSALMYQWEYKDLYNQIDHFPTSALKEQAASLILKNDKQNLSSDQIEKLESYLTE